MSAKKIEDLAATEIDLLCELIFSCFQKELRIFNGALQEKTDGFWKDYRLTKMQDRQASLEFIRMYHGDSIEVNHE